MERPRYRPSDLINLVTLDTALQVIKNVEELQGLAKNGEVVKLTRKGIGEVIVDKTTLAVFIGVRDGAANELVKDGFGGIVRDIVQKHK